MKLYIAEKPSLGRALADVLPKPHKREQGFIRLGNGDVVSWCIGHLLEQVEPEAYDSAYKQWKLNHLPIIPQQWQLQPKAATKKQLNVLKKLIKQADELVHAGDPDREGQLLVDEVINFCGISQSKRNGIKRCLISDLNPTAVRKALQRLYDNRDFIPLSTSALARARADWLYGMNMTRLCTILGKKTGFNGVLSVGRVQTPLLGLIVRRDQEIDAFQPKPYYEVYAILRTENAEQFKAKWQPSEACQPYQDEEGRVLSKKLAENVVERISGQPGTVKACGKKTKKQAPPLPYNLSSLQIDAAKQFSLSAKQVLDTCQSLYEKHKLITYPRSDNRFLPSEHWTQADTVAGAVGCVCSTLQQAISDADFGLRSKAWNDSKVDAHHAIIPTAKTMDGSRLSKAELQLYELIARQYLAQFYPPWVYSDQQIDIMIAGGLFVAKARQTIESGWKALLVQRNNKAEQDKAEQKDKEEQKNVQSQLPEVKVGEILQCIDGELLEKMTTPPKPFTDATLLSAMTGIARFVSDAAVKKVLKETDGLGTEATRAGIIELLFKRGFIQRQGKQIRATQTGRQLISSLPDVATTPDMTAQWESQLNAISQRETSYNHFIESMQASLHPLIKQVEPDAFVGLKAPAQKRRKRYKKRKVA